MSFDYQEDEELFLMLSFIITYVETGAVTVEQYYGFKFVIAVPRDSFTFLLMHYEP